MTMGIIRGNKYFIIIMVLLIYLASRKFVDLTPPSPSKINLNNTWIMPVEGKITQEFKGDKHHGVDIGCQTTDIHASHDGVVSFAGWKGVYGNCVMISHGKGIETLYGHNSKILVKVGDKLKQGDVIAISGNTGHSFGIHCHWELRVNNICVNPLDYVTNKGIIVKDTSNDNFNTDDYLSQDIEGLVK